MAGEQKGKAYEAFAKAALESLKNKRFIRGDVFWDDKPEGMTIVPDLTIGKDKDHLETVLLVTHSGSAKESEKKGWRNMGELAEAKILLPEVPRVFNIAFDSIIKENLKLAQAASFDGQLIVGDLKYGPMLQKWIDGNLARFPKDKHEKVKFIQDEAKSDKVLRALLTAFEGDLKKLLAKKAPVELEQVWAMERKRPAGKAPRARDTFVRRGLSKLLIFEDTEVAVRLFSGKRVNADEVPAYVYELGLATKFSAGASGIAKPADEEISNAITTLGEQTLGKFLSLPVSKSVKNQIWKVRQLSLLSAYQKYATTNWNELIKPKGMVRHLRLIHNSPKQGLGSCASGMHIHGLWLFDFLAALFKAEAGKSQAFGYSTFSKHRSSKSRKIGSMWVGEWCTCFMNQYISRSSTFSPPEEAVAFVGLVLSEKLKELSAVQMVPLVEKIKLQFVAKEFEAVLLTHRGFDPLRLLIEDIVTGLKVDQIRSCFGEKANLPGQATKTTVLRKQRTLINWQSASDAGRDHKKKELCGRAVALRYSWDAKAKKFTPRPRVKKLLLVVDGTWRREDLLALARAGWDEIFYPNEMDKLDKAIV